jgi:hypothetical protein
MAGNRKSKRQAACAKAHLPTSNPAQHTIMYVRAMVTILVRMRTLCQHCTNVPQSLSRYQELIVTTVTSVQTAAATIITARFSRWRELCRLFSARCQPRAPACSSSLATKNSSLHVHASHWPTMEPLQAPAQGHHASFKRRPSREWHRLVYVAQLNSVHRCRLQMSSCWK